MPDVSQPCPLCDGLATHEIVRLPLGKRFTCSNCTEFFIDAPSEVRIKTIAQIDKTKLQVLAREGGADFQLVIHVPHDAPAYGPGKRQRDLFVAELVPRLP